MNELVMMVMMKENKSMRMSNNINKTKESINQNHLAMHGINAQSMQSSQCMFSAKNNNLT
jgi:hypothetical protein